MDTDVFNSKKNGGDLFFERDWFCDKEVLGSILQIHHNSWSKISSCEDGHLATCGFNCGKSGHSWFWVDICVIIIANESVKRINGEGELKEGGEEQRRLGLDSWRLLRGKARLVCVHIGTSKCMLERFLWERCLVIIVDVRTYDWGVTSKKVENYPLEAKKAIELIICPIDMECATASCNLWPIGVYTVPDGEPGHLNSLS